MRPRLGGPAGLPVRCCRGWRRRAMCHPALPALRLLGWCPAPHIFSPHTPGSCGFELGLEVRVGFGCSQRQAPRQPLAWRRGQAHCVSENVASVSWVTAGASDISPGGGHVTAGWSTRRQSARVEQAGAHLLACLAHLPGMLCLPRATEFLSPRIPGSLPQPVELFLSCKSLCHIWVEGRS